ncbi:MAG TPA: hypothetical protein VE152_07110 [Acidimicrobiales bacterium]|nr:hypothetical protein [Acidimicrobiales bacterium]
MRGRLGIPGEGITGAASEETAEECLADLRDSLDAAVEELDAEAGGWTEMVAQLAAGLPEELAVYGVDVHDPAEARAAFVTAAMFVDLLVGCDAHVSPKALGAALALAKALRT